MGRHLLLLALLLSGCPSPNTNPPVAPVVEAGDASPCQVDQAITADRLIRTDASPKGLVLPGCPDGGP